MATKFKLHATFDDDILQNLKIFDKIGQGPQILDGKSRPGQTVTSSVLSS